MARMTHAQMAAELRRLATEGGIDPMEVARQNPRLAKGLPLIVQEDATTGGPAGSGAPPMQPVTGAGLQPVV